MRYSVGYRLAEPDEEPLIRVVEDYRDRIAEVYFPWPGLPSGRSPMGRNGDLVDWDAQRRLETDLAELRDLGIGLNLLLNASCYGRLGASRHLAGLVRSIVGRLWESFGLGSVTTMSPLVAETVKAHFPEVRVRASINMRLGTVKAFEYVAELFDGYYMQREYNRDPGRIAELHEWCGRRGKTLHILANSGCLNFCSVQSYHDNLVAHEAEVTDTVNVGREEPAMCWRFLRAPENWPAFLQNSWIRPEDVRHYEPYFPVMKLATRMHSNPRLVIAAYCNERYQGDLPDLFEPGHGRLFAPWVIDNTRFPEDWFERTTRCDKKCERCGYCTSVLKSVMVKIP